MKMTVLSIHHVSVLVADTAKALDFYCGLLGLEQDLGRPELGFPGAWVKIGDQQIHILELDNPDPTEGRPIHGGRDRHLAVLVDDLAGIEQGLETRQIPFSRSKSGRKAIFCRDPDGNAVELIEQT
ncbi:MAG: VOC family protein [Gammaproteobacteria bacterium]|nr:VOC family protein [Gammaproteobacteria bacterium]